jgi:hypothetical protein
LQRITGEPDSKKKSKNLPSTTGRVRRGRAMPEQHWMNSVEPLLDYERISRLTYVQTPLERGSLMRECPKPRLNLSHEKSLLLVVSNYLFRYTFLKTKKKELLRKNFLERDYLVSTYYPLDNHYLASNYWLLTDPPESFRTGMP